MPNVLAIAPCRSVSLRKSSKVGTAVWLSEGLVLLESSEIFLHEPNRPPSFGQNDADGVPSIDKCCPSMIIRTFNLSSYLITYSFKKGVLMVTPTSDVLSMLFRSIVFP